jgi:hypothetical protein
MRACNGHRWDWWAPGGFLGVNRIVDMVSRQCYTGARPTTGQHEDKETPVLADRETAGEMPSLLAGLAEIAGLGLLPLSVHPLVRSPLVTPKEGTRW